MRPTSLNREHVIFFSSPTGIRFGLNQFMPKLLRRLAPGQKPLCALSDLATGS